MENNKKAGRYERMISQLEELFIKTNDPFARMATIVAVLHHKMDNFFWTGFYRLVEGELTISAYQGSLACLVLKKHVGVCWAAIDNQQTTIVDDVHHFPGHIACDSRSNSEIVVPVYNQQNELVAVLDVDSIEFANFDEIDKTYLERICKMIYL